MKIRGPAGLLIAFALAGCASAGGTETLDVGPGKTYTDPARAIAAAFSGDTVRIYPGTYHSCAVVRHSNITIEGAGPGAVLSGTTCEGKAILVTDGNNIAIRGLTLQGASVPDGNGAGIRAEGGNLLVENVRFIDNQNGILAAPNPAATIRVLDSYFSGNGVCGRACAHGIYANQIRLLDVEHSHFTDTHEGHNIKSRALNTKIADNVIEDGPNGTSSYGVDIPNGGAVLIEGNRMEKEPKATNWGTEIMIGEEGVRQPTPVIVIRNNVLTNNTGHTTTFVRNLTATPARLFSNLFKGGPVRLVEQ